MSCRGQSSDTRSRALGEYNVGGDSRTYTISSDNVGQPRKKKFSSPKCYYGSNAILFQSYTKLNPDRLNELELKVEKLDMELNFRVQSDPRGVQDNKCLCVVIIVLSSILFVLAIKGMF
ncbi:hypothetical protein PIB30_049887 [Stylosanthes scabra]|uniref:Uncharacterized protein n=1 Tax=Stylosanthes scabra TaxID=79078 RepID=A0ABU6WHT8_9FABA|nr:hypothetical protein [Stylosanthes scabra]